MEVETGVALRGSEYALEAQLEVEQICRVCADSGERSIEIHCDALHAGKAVRDEVAHVCSLRDTTIDHGERKRSDLAADVRNLSDESAIDVEGHCTRSVHRPALAISCASEVAGIPDECRVAEPERRPPHDDRVVELLAIGGDRVLELRDDDRLITRQSVV